MVWGLRGGIAPMFFLLNCTFCTQRPFQSHTHAHSRLSTCSSNLKHAFLRRLTHTIPPDTQGVLKTGKYEAIPANSYPHVRWRAHTRHRPNPSTPPQTSTHTVSNTGVTTHTHTYHTLTFHLYVQSLDTQLLLQLLPHVLTHDGHTLSSLVCSVAPQFSYN